jgi:hypothetical protein
LAGQYSAAWFIKEGTTQVGTTPASHSGFHPYTRWTWQGFAGVRRSLPKSAAVSVEIPSAPIGPAEGLKTASRIMQAKTVWVGHLDEYHLLGLKFARPLHTDGSTVSGRHLRKIRSAV